jgi:cytochrome c peroxidase
MPPDSEHNYSGLSAMEKVGKKIFFDKNLSQPIGQSCASCHNFTTGFADPGHLAFSQGALGGQYLGSRSAPSVAYLKYAPALYYNTTDSTYVGGFFWDGRANSLEQQAIKPMLNPIEMNNSSITQIVSKLRSADYSSLFTEIYGESVFDDTTVAIQFAASAIAAYERSAQVNPFNSKYDLYLKGKALLTSQELRGLQLFNDSTKGNCAACHPSNSDNGPALFTDFTYDNLGVPHNPLSPQSAPDYGLGGFLNDAAHNGRFKVPTLRNVAVTAPYFHNGYFQTLEEVVAFYSDRDSVGLYPQPEVSLHVNHGELGDLHLTKQDVSDIAAFLRTLTDGYKK